MYSSFAFSVAYTLHSLPVDVVASFAFAAASFVATGLQFSPFNFLVYVLLLLCIVNSGWCKLPPLPCTLMAGCEVQR